MTGEHWPALTVRQPWAFAIERGGKSPENRPRNMRYRGPLWLHSGARSRWDTWAMGSALVRDAWNKHVRSVPDWPGLPCSDVELGRKTTLMAFGAVTSLAEVTGCHHASQCTTEDAATWQVRRCTEWAVDDEFHIELEVRQILTEPVTCRGALGLWRLPGDVEEAARAHLNQIGGAARWPAKAR